jgi:hypothetical protein
MKKKQRILRLSILGISLLIAILFLTGEFTLSTHWWVLVAWFFPVLGGVSIPYFKRGKNTQ